VDALLSGCPSASDVAAINGDLQLTFEGSLAGGPLVCSAAGGSANMTETQRRVYQTLRVLRALSFQRPLPWTSQGLYPWLVSAIDGIRFRTDISVSFCCDPSRYINVAVGSNSYLLLTPRWIDAQLGGGLYDLAALFVHESRHSDGKPHTCGNDDQTLGELGAWAAQYYFGIWAALYSGSLLDGPDPDPGAYRASEIGHAEQTLQRICSLPTANLAISVTDSPDPVDSGATLTYTAHVTNSGPDAAPEAFVEAETPAGTRFTGAAASQGSCVGPPLGAVGPIGCSLGALTSGASATLTWTFEVVAPPGETIARSGSWTAHVTGSARDGASADNSSSASTAVIAAPRFQLTVAKSGTGSGTVSSGSGGIDCGTVCGASFAAGTTVTLTATAASNSTFAGWSGACGGTGSCTLTMDAPRSVTATFRQVLTPPKCVVPNVKGKPLATAKRLIAKAHCTTGKVTAVRSKSVAKGKVISQSPKAGKKPAAGSKVSLVVSRGKR
jgi:uncharacterized repeat protein (TIGR01451 family)